MASQESERSEDSEVIIAIIKKGLDTSASLIKSDPRHLALIEQIGQAHLEKPRRIDAEIGPRSANPMTQELHFGKGIVIFRFRS